jgi:hypothetical protein
MGPLFCPGLPVYFSYSTILGFIFWPSKTAGIILVRSRLLHPREFEEGGKGKRIITQYHAPNWDQPGCHMGREDNEPLYQHLPHLEGARQTNCMPGVTPPS